jgi:hypothetical protein
MWVSEPSYRKGEAAMSSRILKLAALGAMVLAVLASTAIATPTPDGVIVKERIFNDCPLSAFTAVNGYPASIVFTDVGDNCYGWANLHVWRFAQGGVEAVFNNNSAFQFSATVVLDGTGVGEAGLQITPWWSQDVDGRLQIRDTADGEVACWGGRLPFYSFTVNNSLVYQKGHALNFCVTYMPNGLSSTNPATIQYKVIYDGNTYMSPLLAFDQGNPAEDPPHGLWGMLNDGRVGGYLQCDWALGGDPFATVNATWSDICFQNLDSVPTENATWGGVKNLYR